MRKLPLVFASAALAAFSAGATWYLLQNPVHRDSRADRIIVGPAEPERILTPDQLLVKPAPAPDAGQDAAGDPADSGTVLDDPVSTQALDEEESSLARHAPALLPDWQPGETRLIDPQPITERDGYILPRWSPVGLDLVFTKADAATLWISGTTPGSRVRLLADDPGVGDGFTWNLDGMSVHARAGDGRFVDILITGEQYPAPERTPKVFERDGRIWLRPEGGGEPVAISGPEDRFHSPLLSPDESKVVYQGEETGLYMAAADGSRTIMVGPGEHPSWLPDSSGIVYSRAVYDDRGPVDGDLWFASADGRERSRLTATPGTVESHPHVAPDGLRIAYTSDGAIHVARFLRPLVP